MNPYCDCKHMNRNHTDEGFGACQVQGCDCQQFHNNQLKIEDKVAETDPLILKAQSELARIPLVKFRQANPDFDERIFEIIRIYQSFDLSSHKSDGRFVIDIIRKTLEGLPLSPLTDNPDEWEVHTAPGDLGGTELWQNKRDPRMFSSDNGETCWDPYRQQFEERQVTLRMTDAGYDR